MTREDITTYNGKEYVTINEFAKRVNSGASTIKRKLSEGKLKATQIEGRRARYLEWETSKRMWDLMPHDIQRSNAGKRSNALRYRKAGEEGLKEPEVFSPSASMPGMEGDEIPDILDLATFDKTKYRDCLIDGEFDYEKLKLRLTAETYQQKLHKERGQLVEREEVLNWVKRLGTIVNSGLESIPQKYTSVLIAQVQAIVAQRLDRPDFEFTDKERTDIRTTLKACGPEIMRNVRLMIMEVTEE